MQVKTIQCPNCKTVLQVKNSKNETVKTITCPKCKTVLQVKFHPQQEPIEAHTFIAKPYSPTHNNGATQLGGRNDGSTQLVSGNNDSTQLINPSAKSAKTVRLQYGGLSYPLSEGCNIIGRKATTSTATVQIATTDRYMSRQHCSITVTTLPDGTKKAVLSNYQNKNQTTIDGQPVEAGDSIRLTNGNTITMGHTTLVFHS